MKSTAKISIMILMVAIAAVAVASVFLMKNSTNSNLAVQTAPAPSVTQTPSPTQEPTQVTATPSVPTITISYQSLQTQCGHYMIDITITNQGYSNFTTDPTKFSVTAGGQKYAYSASFTKEYGFWTTTSVSNQGSYDGTLIFEAPSTATSASLSYNDANYNIVYEVK
jgi:uncharacterized protein DUF4352